MFKLAAVESIFPWSLSHSTKTRGAQDIATIINDYIIGMIGLHRLNAMYVLITHFQDRAKRSINEKGHLLKITLCLGQWRRTQVSLISKCIGFFHSILQGLTSVIYKWISIPIIKIAAYKYEGFCFVFFFWYALSCSVLVKTCKYLFMIYRFRIKVVV